MVRSDFRGRGDLTPRVFLYGYNPAVRLCNAGVPRAAASCLPLWRRDLSTSFIFISTICLVFAVVILAGSFRRALLPRVESVVYDDISFSASLPLGKDSLMSRMNAQQKRQLAGQVHYVTEIIRSIVPNHREANKLAYAIVAEGMRASVDPIFIAAVIKSESTFNKAARSYAGALGLMQLMPDTARYVTKLNDFQWHGLSKLTSDPSYNIKLGATYLKYLHNMYGGNRELMLIAYNWGPSNLSYALRNGQSIPSGPKKYARTIISDHARWKQEYAQRLPEFQYLSLANFG